METNGDPSTKRSVALFLLIVASLVAIAALMLIVLDNSRTPMYFTLVGALITIYINARTLKRGQSAR